MIRHVGLLLALAGLVLALLVHNGGLRWLAAVSAMTVMTTSPAMAVTGSAHARIPPVRDEEIYPIGTLGTHAWRLERLEEAVKDLRAELHRELAVIKESSTWTTRFLFGALVGIAFNLWKQLGGNKPTRGRGRDGERDE